MRNFEEKLTGGHPNSLGNTIELVEEVLANNTYFDELFNCYFSADEVVRLRVSNAMKRICKENEDLLVPYLDRFLTEIAAIDQASTQWTLATLFEMLQHKMTEDQIRKAKEIMKNNLSNHIDWIVLNNTMEVLWNWSKSDEELREWILPHLDTLSKDHRKSVAKRANKLLGRMK